MKQIEMNHRFFFCELPIKNLVICFWLWDLVGFFFGNKTTKLFEIHVAMQSSVGGLFPLQPAQNNNQVRNIMRKLNCKTRKEKRRATSKKNI